MAADVDPKRQLGKIALQQKLVAAGNLAPASAAGRARMAEALRALAEAHGVPWVDLTDQVVPIAALRLVPAEIVQERLAFPFAVEGDDIKVAMATPGDAEAVQEIEFVAGKRVVPHVAPDSVLRHVIEHAYALVDSEATHFVGSGVTAERLAAMGLSELEPSPSPPPWLEPPAPAPGPLPSAAIVDVSPVAAAEPHAEPAAPAPAPPAPPAPGSAQRSRGTPLDEAFADRTRTSRASPVPAPMATGQVLLAVGAPDRRRAIERALAAQGIAVFEADNGAAALALVRDVLPGVLVLDAALPSLSGFEVARRLFGDDKFRGTPVILLSDSLRGWRVAEDLRENYGVMHLVETPIDPEALARTIRLALQGRPLPPPPPPLSAEAAKRLTDGIAAFEKGELERAIAEMEAGVRIDGEAFEMHYHLGLLYGRREDLFAAVRALDRAVELQPRSFAALKNLAVVCQRAGLRRKARDSWERALSVAPDEATAATIRQHLVSTLL